MLQSRTFFQGFLSHWNPSSDHYVCIFYSLKYCPRVGRCGRILGISVFERGREGGRGEVYAVETDNIDYL
jgi:hypothetical protein